MYPPHVQAFFIRFFLVCSVAVNILCILRQCNYSWLIRAVLCQYVFCAAGIDVEQVTVVVNFDLPLDHNTRRADCETYLHRIGRTGRFGKNGLAINMVDGPRTMAMLKEIESHFGKNPHCGRQSSIRNIYYSPTYTGFAN